jgi:hypothetical protein
LIYKKKLGDTDRLLYEIGLVALGICIAAVLLYFCTGINLLTIGYPCLFNKLTHLCCPGCGGTRSIRALIRGDLWRCFYDYPPFLFGLAVYVIFMVRCFLHVHFDVRKSKDGTVVKYLYVFMGLIFVQWIVKLVAQICFNYYWFG